MAVVAALGAEAAVEEVVVASHAGDGLVELVVEPGGEQRLARDPAEADSEACITMGTAAASASPRMTSLALRNALSPTKPG